MKKLDGIVHDLLPNPRLSDSAAIFHRKKETHRTPDAGDK
jgi:hypothetical protein